MSGLFSNKSLRPLFSSNQERKKSHLPPSGCSSIQRYKRSESIMSRRFEYRLWKVFAAIKKPTPSFLFKSRENKLLAPPNVWLKPTETWKFPIFESILSQRSISVEGTPLNSPKKYFSSIKRGRKKLSPSSEKSWFCEHEKRLKGEASFVSLTEYWQSDWYTKPQKMASVPDIKFWS